MVPQIQQRGQDYGKNPNPGLRDAQDPSKGKKRIVIEFSSPNIAKSVFFQPSLRCFQR